MTFEDTPHRSVGDSVDRSGLAEIERHARPRPRRRPVIRVLVGLLVVLVVYFAVNLAQVVVAGRHDPAGEYDAIVVLGAAQYDGRPSPQLAARLDHVVTLWNDGLAPRVVVTGGKQPADRFTEAEASRRYLIDRGVPETVIVMEGKGATTYESLSGAADLLLAGGADHVVVVTDPYHALRTRLTADEVGFDATVSATPTSVVTGRTSVRRDLQEAAGVSLGRIIGFRRLSELTG